MKKKRREHAPSWRAAVVFAISIHLVFLPSKLPHTEDWAGGERESERGREARDRQQVTSPLKTPTTRGSY